MQLRDFRQSDSDRVNQIAVAAFGELEQHYDDWAALSANLGNMSALAEQFEIIVSEDHGGLVGAVAYVGPGKEKAVYFDPSWPIIRMLVVDPARRGVGAGRALTEACIDRAMRDESPVIALHTSPIMTVALPMYLRMGFEFVRDTPPIRGVPYAVYLKSLQVQN